jgi:hypothetical protein
MFYGDALAVLCEAGSNFPALRGQEVFNLQQPFLGRAGCGRHFRMILAWDLILDLVLREPD